MATQTDQVWDVFGLSLDCEGDVLHLEDLIEAVPQLREILAGDGTDLIKGQLFI